MDREQTDNSQRGEGVGCWVKKVKALRKKTKNNLIDTDNSMVKGVGEVEEGKEGMNDGGSIWLGVVNTMQYTDDVLWSCTPETYIILLTNVTPNKFNIIF